MITGRDIVFCCSLCGSENHAKSDCRKEALPDLIDSHCECLSATRDRDDCCATDLYSVSPADHCGCCDKGTALATKKPCVMDCHKLATKVRRATEEAERRGAYKLFLALRERSQQKCRSCEPKLSVYEVAEEFDKLFQPKDNARDCGCGCHDTEPAPSACSRCCGADK